jgi:ElaB/YqjD/DUF883 family membrane-anchored ribosome-binding protein
MSDLTTHLTENQTRLADDLRAVADDAEALLRQAVRDTGKGYDDARSRLEGSLKAARTELAGIEQSVIDSARHAGQATDAFVHRNPWPSIGAGACVGVLLGMLIARR